MPGWQSRLGVVEWEVAEIIRSCHRCAATDCVLYLAFYCSLLAAQLATTVCDSVCVGGLAMRPLTACPLARVLDSENA